MPTQRLDLHRPSAIDFDPEAYEVAGVFDSHVRFGNTVSRHQTVQEIESQGITLGAGSSINCGHCGTRIRYSAILIRRDIHEYIFVGETCLDNRFTSLTAQQFQTLRTEARLNSERENRRKSRASIIAAHPTLVWLTYPDTLRLFASDFLRNVAYQFRKYGKLSDRQIVSAERAIIRDSERYYAQKEREAQWENERAMAAPIPAGRTAVLGEVISVKWSAGYAFNAPDVKKIQIKTDSGWRVHLTCPASIIDAKKGDQVAVTVTITPSSDDPSFGYGKRPMLAEIVSTAIVSTIIS